MSYRYLLVDVIDEEGSKKATESDLLNPLSSSAAINNKYIIQYIVMKIVSCECWLLCSFLLCCYSSLTETHLCLLLLLLLPLSENCY